MKEILMQKPALIDGGTAIGAGVIAAASPYIPWIISFMTIIVLGYRIYLSHQQAKINRKILDDK